MIPVKTITFSQIMSSVKEDLSRYDREGMINDLSLIKVVRRCNDTLGVNLYKPKSCVITIDNGIGDLPLDFYKLEMAFLVGPYATYNTGPIAMGNHYEWSGIRSACMCEGNTAVCVTPVEQHQGTLTFVGFTPLTLNNRMLNDVCGYSPNRGWQSDFTLDLDDQKIKVGIKKGLVYFSYLADLVDDQTGELLVPFHGRLNDYYEYSIKSRIMENLLMNSDEPVVEKLKYFKNEANLAASDAIDFVMSKSYREHTEMRKKREQKFYNEHFKMFF